MKTLAIPTSDRRLRKMIRQAGGDTMVLTDAGVAVAAVVPLNGVDAESLSLSTNRRFLSILRKSFRELDTGRGISLAEVRRRLSAARS